MAQLFPKPLDKYPILDLEDTDLELPEHVVNNTMRYTHFKTIAKGGKGEPAMATEAPGRTGLRLMLISAHPAKTSPGCGL